MHDASSTNSLVGTPAVMSAAQRLAQQPPFNAPENNIVLLSADVVRLGFRRVFLETASDVFESTSLIAAESGAQAMEVDQEVPVIPLAKNAADLATFLRFLDPRELNPVLKRFQELERCVLLHAVFPQDVS